jgi:hypothetical protein
MGRNSSPGRVLLHMGPTGCEVHLVSFPMSNTAPYSGTKRQWREADHSLPTSAEVKKTLVYTFTPPYTFMTYCLIKYRVNFTFTYKVEILTVSCNNKFKNIWTPLKWLHLAIFILLRSKRFWEHKLSSNVIIGLYESKLNYNITYRILSV